MIVAITIGLLFMTHSQSAAAISYFPKLLPIIQDLTSGVWPLNQF